MGLPVVTVATGGLAVADVTATTPKFGLPVDEAPAGRGIAVTKVAAGKPGLPVIWATGGSGGGTSATLDGVASNVTLSNGNLTATHASTTAPAGARSTASKTTGKYYFEVSIGVAVTPFDGVGVLSSTGTYADVQAAANCLIVYLQGGIYALGASSGKSIGAISVGNVIGVAVDLDARKGWIRSGAGTWNGDPTHNPATGAGGIAFTAAVPFAPVIYFDTGGAGNARTGNFGQSAYANAAPAGFGNWTT
jgi:hypothetical protein